MAFDVHERGTSDPSSSVQLIDLTEEEAEAPFAVREADEALDAASNRIPDKAEMLAWLEDHPVVVGIATGVLCFSIIAGAMSVVLGSDSDADDNPVAGASLSETDGSQGSFSSSGSGGANFTSDDSKLSRTGAGKDLDDIDDGESAAGAGSDATGPSGRNSAATGQSSRTSPGITTDLNQNANTNTNNSSSVGGAGTGTGTGTGQAPRPASSTTTPAGTSGGAAGNTNTTLNPGPNVSGPVPTTAPTATTVPTSSATTRPTTPTTGQTTSTPQISTSTPTSTPSSTSTTASAPPASVSFAAPGNGTSHSFDTPTNFAVNFVAGATEYCWSFTQSGSAGHSACTSGTTYQLPARPSGLGPGLVTVTVTASGSFGTVNDSIQISLTRSRVINNPTRDLEIGTSTLRVGVINLNGATSYCFQLTQAGYSSGSLCYSSPGTTFNKNHPIWDSLSPGPLTVSATIYSGSTVMATDSVTINLI